MSGHEGNRPMVVTRVLTDLDSHIEPPLDRAWSHHEQLRWKAGVILADTGVSVSISASAGLPRRFGLYGPGWGLSSTGFADCWTLLTGFELGAEAAQAAARPALTWICVGCQRVVDSDHGCDRVSGHP